MKIVNLGLNLKTFTYDANIKGTDQDDICSVSLFSAFEILSLDSNYIITHFATSKTDNTLAGLCM